MELLSNESELALHPENINIKLKNHQLAMLQKCYTIENINDNNFGIMNDRPGTGKTYVILSLIYQTLQNKSLNTKNTNIIVVPQNIYSQWILSIEQFSKNLTYKKFINYEHIISLYNDPNILFESNVILTTSSYYHIIATTLHSLDINIDRVFFDEIDSISNIICTKIKSNFIWFISASFNKNDLGYYKNKISDHNFDKIICKCTNDFIDENIYLDEPNKIYYLCQNIYIDSILDNVLSKKELMSLNAMDFTLNNKDFEKLKAKNEKEVIEIILQNRKSIISFDKFQIEDAKKNIDFYNKFKEDKDKIENNFKNTINKISIINDFKKYVLDFLSNFDENTTKYIHSVIINDDKDGEKIIKESRKDEIKFLWSSFQDIIELLYNMSNGEEICNNYYIKKNNNASVYNFSVQLKNMIVLITDIYEIIFKLKSQNIIDLVDETNNSLLSFYDKTNETKNFINELILELSNFDNFLKSDNQLNVYNKILELCSKNIINNENKINLIYDRLNNNNCCPVCYEEFDKNKECKIYITSTCCNNKICEFCIDNWYNLNKTSCIFCNTENVQKETLIFFEKNNKCTQEDEQDIKDIQDILDMQDAQYLQNKQLSNKKIETFDDNKIIFLKKFIENIKDKDYKVIIFSDYSNIFDNIKLLCTKSDVIYIDLDKGNIKDIDLSVNEYKYGNAKILFSNSTLFGCGMNFENSTHIIFVHKMEKEIEKQVIGRAQRMGRTSTLNIIYLQYDNENENEYITKKNSHLYINEENEESKSDLLDGYYNEQQYYILMENIQHFEFTNSFENNINLNISTNEINELDKCTIIEFPLEEKSKENIDINLEKLFEEK